eukprot:TRINITY_DN52_c0_g1_i4.p1 TRINITY_DN52_c0_g1~~TRINITY_DN52_c0_g1_i4.p1  ORF type:complete len:450 (+),score=68.24 TRINITY_DN52_c0_g1_i4:103-1452(+)
MSRLHLALIFAFALLCARAQTDSSNPVPGSTAAEPSSTNSPSESSTANDPLITGTPASSTGSSVATGSPSESSTGNSPVTGSPVGSSTESPASTSAPSESSTSGDSPATGSATPVSTGMPEPMTTGMPEPVTTGMPEPVTTGMPAPVTTGMPPAITSGPVTTRPMTTRVPAPVTTKAVTSGMPAPVTTGSVAASNYVRFINAIQGQTLTFMTNNGPVNSALSPLAYKGITDYIPVWNNSITVVSVTNGQISFTNVAILIELKGWTTVAAQYNLQGTFDLIRYDENFPSTATPNSGKAWLRVISLGGAVGGISIAAEGTPILTGVTNLQGTSFVGISATTSSIWIYQSGGMAANTYPLSLNGGFTANGVYTIFWFTPSASAPEPRLVYDRNLAGTSMTSTGSNDGTNDGTNDNSNDGDDDITIDSINPEDSFATKAQISLALGVIALFTL